MKTTRAYLAHQFGFSETGIYILEELIKPRIVKIGIEIYDPFIECAKELDTTELDGLEGYDERIQYLLRFSKKITPINNKLMQNSDCMLAILDGGHTVDDGVASEIGYYAGINQGPIFALRSDFRCGENIAITVNPQLLGYIDQTGGELIDGEDAIKRWFKRIEEWYDSFT